MPLVFVKSLDIAATNFKYVLNVAFPAQAAFGHEPPVILPTRLDAQGAIVDEQRRDYAAKMRREKRDEW